MGVNDMTNGLRYLGGTVGEFCSANKAHIYTGIGIGGTILTGVLAAQSGARSARKIDRRERELGRSLSFGEKTRLCWTEAIAPVAVGAVSCYSTFKVDRTLSAELAKRTTMLIASEKAYERLSQKTKEVLGDKKAKQVQDEIVKDKIDTAVQAGVLSEDAFAHAPRVGHGQLYMFVDEYTMLPFWSNIDYVTRQIVEMRQMMSDLASRDPNNDYYDKIVGVHFTEWLRRIGYTDPHIVATKEREDLGWNKGYDAKYHQDDDEIDIVTTSKTWAEGISVTAVVFTTPPTDMKMGRYRKSSGLV